jgi:hypothetical protein
MATARSRRCSVCDIDWPLAEDFKKCKKCKKCGGETWQNDDKPLSWAEAQTLIRHVEEHATNEAQRRDEFEKKQQEFELYYADRAVKEFRAQLEAL